MYRGQTLQVRAIMYIERNVQGIDIKTESNVQGTDSCLQDGDHIDGHYITLYAEQLTRLLEVLVLLELWNIIILLQVLLGAQICLWMRKCVK